LGRKLGLLASTFVAQWTKICAITPANAYTKAFPMRKIKPAPLLNLREIGIMKTSTIQLTVVFLTMLAAPAGYAKEESEKRQLIDFRDASSIRKQRPILIAHRGGVVTAQTPECSLAAIRLAKQQGYAIVELDIQQSKDQVPIVFHDSNMRKACGINKRISDLNADEIVKIPYVNTDQTVCTLDQALRVCHGQGLGLMLDVKVTGDEAFFKKIVSLVKKHGYENASITINGDPALRKHLKDVALLTVTRDEFKTVQQGGACDLRDKFWFGLPPGLPSEMVKALQRNGAYVMPAINTFRYPADGHYELARKDIQRLNDAGVDGYQIDSVYRPLFSELAFPQAGKTREINLGTLLGDMVDRAKIAEFPSPEFLCKQCSSYNRETVARDKPGWFANADSSYFYGHEDVDGRREWIMMDVDGPGAVVRWWLTQQRFEGTIRIYLDGAQAPVYAATADQLVGGAAITGKPLSNVVGWNGRNLYLPIPFKQHCKITYDGPNMHDTGQFADCIYYNINYIQYPRGTEVKTFTRDDLNEHAALLGRVQATLLQPEAHTLAVAREAAGKASVLGSGESFAREIEGTGAISCLEVKLDTPEIEQAMRTVVISISFDGKERVCAPVGEFFGCGPGLNPFKGWWRQVQSNGWMSCWWPMPFKRKASVKIINYGQAALSVELGDIGITHWPWTDRTMYFNSTWRMENQMDTGQVRDWNYLTVEGRGVYVGDTLALFNRAKLPHPKGTGTWWGEGDEKIFVDKEAFPSTFGTGTEDYYGYAWGVGGTFEAPFHAMPRGDANGNYTKPGHTTNTRVRSLDRIPFKRHLQLDMELLHWQKSAKVDYAVATYWYALDGSTGNGEVTPEQLGVKVGDLTGWIAGTQSGKAK